MVKIGDRYSGIYYLFFQFNTIIIRVDYPEQEKLMKERITKYLKYMDDLLERIELGEEMDLQKILKNHMVQIGFFMHERLVHLIVTVLFAIGTFMTIFTYLIVNNIGLLLLALLLIVLLIPYIKHYYLLENGVQKMYKQYDKLLEHRAELGENIPERFNK